MGEDRVSAQKAVNNELGGNYEVFEGSELAVDDLPSIFQGLALFQEEERRILLKNVSENTAVWEKMGEYADTEHKVIVWETKIDKRSTGYKQLKAKGVQLQEFALQTKPEMRQVFGIFDLALKGNGEGAVRMVEKIELEQDPFMFFGLMVTQALKKFEARQGERERRILKELAKLDMQMKGESVVNIEAWTLIKAFLLRLKMILEM